MKFKKIALAFGLGHSRVSRLKTSRSSNRKLVFSSLEFELEKRQLLATFVVDNLNNSGTGSLRQAIADGAATSDGQDIINFNASLSYPGTITLASNSPLTISGANLTNLVIHGPGAANLTISGANASGVFIIRAAA